MPGVWLGFVQLITSLLDFAQASATVNRRIATARNLRFKQTSTGFPANWISWILRFVLDSDCHPDDFVGNNDFARSRE
jgi:hypothetical protein